MMTEKSDQVSQSKELRDRVAIVTGAGQGMGRGIARCLALAGANVVVAEQANDRIAAVVAQLEDLGVQALGIATDVSRGEDVQTTDRDADGQHRQRRATPAHWKEHSGRSDGAARGYRPNRRFSRF
jgi:NAD(P)-dependent dehydrogenase (short-subunit alcohol dehydrogenase family)